MADTSKMIVGFGISDAKLQMYDTFDDQCYMLLLSRHICQTKIDVHGYFVNFLVIIILRNKFLYATIFILLRKIFNLGVMHKLRYHIIKEVSK